MEHKLVHTLTWLKHVIPSKSANEMDSDFIPFIFSYMAVFCCV